MGLIQEWLGRIATRTRAFPSSEFADFRINDNPFAEKFSERIPLLFDTDQLHEDRFPLVNGFSKRDLSPKYFMSRSLDHEGYFGLFGPRFLRIFHPRTSVSESEFFYYPIVITLIDITAIFKRIAIPREAVEKILKGRGKVLLVCPYEGWSWKIWQEFVDVLSQKYQIPGSKVVVLSGNYAEPRPGLPAVGFNVWEYFRQFDGGFGHSRQDIIQSIRNRLSRSYRFVCLSRRPTPERMAITTLLYPHRDKGILTCARFGGHDRSHAKWQERGFQNLFPELAERYFSDIEPRLPLRWSGDTVNPEVDNPADDFDHQRFAMSYLSIVPETFFAHDPERMFFSEKIFKPIVSFQPFVMIAQPGSLAQLRRLGYRSFAPYIDESYDEELDDRKRLHQAAREIIRIISLPDSEITSLMINVLPILEHNYKNLQLRTDRMLPELHRDLLKLLISNS